MLKQVAHINTHSATSGLKKITQLALDDITMPVNLTMLEGKGKASQLQAWTGCKSSRRFRIPDFKTHEGGKLVSPTYRPPLPPGNIPGTHFC